MNQEDKKRRAKIDAFVAVVRDIGEEIGRAQRLLKELSVSSTWELRALEKALKSFERGMVKKDRRDSTRPPA